MHHCGGRKSIGEEAGTVAICPACGDERTVKEYGSGRYVARWWTDCQCITTRIAEEERRTKEREDWTRRDAQERLAKQLGLWRVRDFRINTFQREWLQAAHDADHPLDYALRWLEGVRGTDQGHYHHGPPPALYFYSQGKGRGKTHLASALAWHAYDWGYLAAFCEETSYLSQYWAAEFEDRDKLQTLVGDRAWITVIDDLGQTPPAKKGGESGAARAWYDITNRRWLRRGWTIITSNRTLDELADQGTINDASYSRLFQMTRGQMVVFDGDDYRLEGLR